MSLPDLVVGASIGCVLMLIAVALRDWVNHMACLYGYTRPRRTCRGCGEVFETALADTDSLWKLVPRHGHPNHPNGWPRGSMPGNPA